MPSDSNHSPATARVSRSGSATPVSCGVPGSLDDLIAQSDAAVAALLAATDRAAFDAALEVMAEESHAAAQRLIAHYCLVMPCNQAASDLRGPLGKTDP